MLVFIQVSFLIIIPKGAFVWDKSGIRIIGIMRVNVCLGAILIPEYLDIHSGYSPRSRLARIYYNEILQVDTRQNLTDIIAH